MDFVAWCDVVLKTVSTLMDTSPTARMIGVSDDEIGQALLAPLMGNYWQSEQQSSVIDALHSLTANGLITDRANAQYYKLTDLGREHLENPVTAWEQICRQKVRPDQAQVIVTLNRLSPHVAEKCAWLEVVPGNDLVRELGWEQQIDLLHTVVQELLEMEFIGGYTTMGRSPENFALQAAYAGLVWETRKGFTIESREIDHLVQEWETTSVDFKREVHLDTKDQKAEFVKDVIGLVNTQASGHRWLIIGFDDKTHHYHSAPDPAITANRMEQILATMTVPIVSVRYHVADYRLGAVGMIEVLRDPTQVPYSVARSLAGEKKHITQGQIFVRHGTQTEEPTEKELQALHDEAAFHRSAPTSN